MGIKVKWIHFKGQQLLKLFFLPFKKKFLKGMKTPIQKEVKEGSDVLRWKILY